MNKAKARGAKLIVIDPRRSNTVERADLWLQLRPGTDGMLALSMIHVMLHDGLFDAEFVRQWTNGPFFVRTDNQQLLTEMDLRADGDSKTFFVWDERGNEAISYRPDRGYARDGIAPALTGTHQFTLAEGRVIECRPALECLAEIAAQYAPEITEAMTGVRAGDVRRAVRMMIKEKPSCYYSWVGVEHHRDATQTNRALCILYALTGQFDQRGGNVLFANVPARQVTGQEFLPEEANPRRLGYAEYPLGSPGHSARIQAVHLYRAILQDDPYPVKAMVSFGGDLLMAHADAKIGERALTALDFYAHVDITANPSSLYADILLPASTCWEREGLTSNFTTAEDTAAWVQLRPAVVEPLYESRADLDIVLELAKRLGLNEQFFNGDVDAGFNWQLAPAGVTVKDLREQRVGRRAAGQTRYRKYAEIEESAQTPRGFRTPTRKLEIFSTKLAQAGFAPFPGSVRNDNEQSASEYPLILTSFRLVQFCDQQHRNIPRLRKGAREPYVEINPETAQASGIRENDSVFLETPSGAVRLKAKLNRFLERDVVATQHGWWQACAQLDLPAYEPLSSAGANINLILSSEDRDPISGAVAHRSQRCRLRRT